MVGEIRDSETMQIAVEAAMTGHLVLSTLHTNSAAGTLPRLLDMGAEAFLVASTVNVIIAQRLVRKLCNECRVEYKLDAKEIESFGMSFDMETILETLKKEPQLEGQIEKKSNWKDVKFYRAKGCDKCNNEGYRGRLGIYEVLEMDEKIGKLITSNASEDELNKQAKENGMLSMSEDGFIKAALGLTSLEEVLRVTKE
jgi:type II secretory ATPase GspE/PulE/Tfp pilus assembly ATPase PilB-like protein